MERSIVDSLLGSHELEYAAAIGAVAVLVLMLVRRSPDMRLMALYLLGAVLAIAGAPLLEAGLTALDQEVGDVSPFHSFPTELFLRTFVTGALAGVLGVLLMARAWRDSPER